MKERVENKVVGVGVNERERVENKVVGVGVNERERVETKVRKAWCGGCVVLGISATFFFVLIVL